jgi:peptidoglycan/LPS O-acetylase OafA/YrhL
LLQLPATVTTSTAKIRRPALPALTSLRFFAAFGIVLFHSRGYFGIPRDAEWVFWGKQPVSFFFILSGFILYYSYQSLDGVKGATRFYRARIARIWPLHALTMILAAGLAFVPESEFLPLEWDWTTPFAAVANLLMIHSWIPFWEMPGTFNEVSWSISIEMFFYLIFPLALYKWSTNWKYWILGSVGVIAGLIILCNLFDIPSYIEYYPGLTTAVLFHQGPLARAFEFLLGMTIGLFFLDDYAGLGRISQKSSRNLWTLAEAGSIALVLVNMIVALRLVPEARELVGNGAGSWLSNAGACLSSALMIFIFAYHKGRISELLSGRFLQVLGESSFSLYLIHNLYFATFRSKGHPLVELPLYLQFPVYVAAVLAISYCSWRWFETPMRDLLAPKKATLVL